MFWNSRNGLQHSPNYPRSAKVEVVTEEGFFVAVISEINGIPIDEFSPLVTQGRSLHELVDMVNDLLYMHMGIDERLFRYGKKLDAPAYLYKKVSTLDAPRCHIKRTSIWR